MSPSATSRRVAVAALLLVVAVVGAFAGPAAAGHDGSTPESGSEGESSGEITTTDNSTFRLHQAVGVAGDGGWLLIECEGNTTATHECDKRGELDAGSVSVDYEGDNYGNPPGLYGGGGDEVTVSMGNQSATGEFDCDLRTGTLPAPCTVNGSSSGTDGASLP